MITPIPRPKFRGYALLRDKNGVPKFDHPETAPDEMKAMLTDDDLRLLPRETVAKLGLLYRLEK